MGLIEERTAQWRNVMRIAKEKEAEREMAVRAAGPKFTIFLDFPREIRDLIWSNACEEPRTVDLWTEEIEAPHQTEPAELNRSPFRYRSSQKHPSILHVSQEARSIGLSYYALTFGTSSIEQHDHTIKSPPRIYVNWDHDLILLRDQGLVSAKAGKPHNGTSPRNQAAIDDLRNRTNIHRLAFCINEVAVLCHYFPRMKMDELILYWGELYPNFERFEKYEPFRTGILDPVDTKMELAAALRVDNSWMQSLYFIMQFIDDYIIGPEERIKSWVGIVDRMRVHWVQQYAEEYPGSQTLKFKFARFV